ncbi:MAG TPA: c-type cytochrome domain-containing protein [Verrucomicrobiales bacterium]|nr:c-type cytochrome domain-containing protein [Verrucomicrobiales bacterium]
MTIRIYCPACRTPFDVDDSLAGEKGLCPSCATKFTIRRPDPATELTHPLGLSSAATAGIPLESKPCGLPITMAVAVLCAFGGALIWAFSAFPAGTKNVPPLLDLGGKFHPVFLHLPIGMLIGTIALDLFGGGRKVHSGAVTWLLWFTLLSASLAALAGYFLGLNGHSGETFERHMWAGISVPIATGLTLITKLIHDSKPAMATGIYRIPLFLTAASVTLAGHFGGEMTHGFDLPGKVKGLFATNAPADKTPMEEHTVYQAVIAPLVAEKCISCHGDKKHKGDLRMDSLAGMLKAGDSEKASVVPGKSAESESVRRIALPADDDDHMPPKDKPQLTADELEVFKWWIDAGAKEDVKIKDAGLSDPLKGKVLSLAKTPAAAPVGDAPAKPAPAAAVAQAPLPPGSAEKVAALEKELGITLLPIAQNDNGLTFNCVNVADKFGDAELAKFGPVAERLVDLNLSRSKVTDAGMAAVAGMKNLKRLNLANTAVSDAAADHFAPLGALEYLNLVGTKVSDAAMPKLEKLAALKKLFVWQTGVTKPAAEALHQKLPAITINLGWDSEVKTAQAPPPPPAPAPAAAAPAGPADPEKPVLAGLIQPILDAKCAGCHGEKKQKGKLQVHTFDLLVKGGDSGEKTVVAGKSGESGIIKRASLPADDDDHMPPKDKDQLTEKEIKILKWWIDGGLKNDVKIKDSGIPADLLK